MRTALAGSFQPSKGELRLLERNFRMSTVQALFGSMTVTSASAPFLSVPLGIRSTRAAFTVIRAISSDGVRSPSSTSFQHRPSEVSRPTMPLAAYSNSTSFSMAEWGAWSQAMTSIVPSRSPARTAATSSALRRGGLTLKEVPKPLRASSVSSR